MDGLGGWVFGVAGFDLRIVPVVAEQSAGVVKGTAQGFVFSA